MTIRVNWRALFAAYLRMWGLWLIIPIVFTVGAIGFSIYDIGAAHLRWEGVLYILAIKAALYGTLAIIQLAIVAAVNLYDLLIGPTFSGTSAFREQTDPYCAAGSSSGAAVAAPSARLAAPAPADC